MFSPVHPAKITQAFQERGYRLPAFAWYEVPLALLEEEATVVYFPQPRPHGEFSFKDDSFLPLSTVEFKRICELPALFFEFLEKDQAAGRKPLLFNGIPHVMYKGEIPLDGITTIKY